LKDFKSQTQNKILSQIIRPDKKLLLNKKFMAIN